MLLHINVVNIIHIILERLEGIAIILNRLDDISGKCSIGVNGVPTVLRRCEWDQAKNGQCNEEFHLKLCASSVHHAPGCATKLCEMFCVSYHLCLSAFKNVNDNVSMKCLTIFLPTFILIFDVFGQTQACLAIGQRPNAFPSAAIRWSLLLLWVVHCPNIPQLVICRQGNILIRGAWGFLSAISWSVSKSAPHESKLRHKRGLSGIDSVFGQEKKEPWLCICLLSWGADLDTY